MNLNNEDKDGLLIVITVIAILLISIGIVEKFPDIFGKYNGGGVLSQQQCLFFIFSYAF